MNALDSKPRAWPIWCGLACIPLILVAAWLFGEIGILVATVAVGLAYSAIDNIPVRAPTGQDHMTKNPGRGS